MLKHKIEFAKTLSELMQKYNEYREKWLYFCGTEIGFNEWFTAQCKNKKEQNNEN
jgi:hypothetical protein